MKGRKGQGAVNNVHQRFSKIQLEEIYADHFEDEGISTTQTEWIEVFPKTIVNHNKGKNLPELSLNPYQGCEHGCSYCYARPTHEFWSYNAGVDFERKILYKPNAPELLKAFFQKKNYLPKTITLSGNTDCYQPVEAKLKITRALLETFWEHKHPLGIITKNSLLLRDLDLLEKLAKYNLVAVAISFNSLDESLRRTMEPRTSSVKNKLKAIKILSDLGIPVSVMVAPIIPGLNSSEIMSILEQTSQAGASYAGYTMVRLNDSTQAVFQEWIEEHFPNKASKVMNQIRAMHQGELGHLKNSTSRKGSGEIAKVIRQTFAIGKKKYFPEAKAYELNTTLFQPQINGQLRLF